MGIFAFGLAERGPAFGQQMLGVAHGRFGRSFDHFRLRSALEPARFAASPGIALLAAVSQLVEPVRFDLRKRWTQTEKRERDE